MPYFSRSVLVSSALAVAALGGAPAAHATANAAASIGVVTWTLTDLDPLDGIAPSFSTQYAGGFVSVSAPNGNGAIQFLTGNYANATATDASAYGSASASSFSTGGQTNSQALGSGVAGTQVTANTTTAPFTAGFTLSPRTSVTVSMPASLSASTTVGYSAGNSESAESFGELIAADGGVSFNYVAYRSVSVSYGYDGAAYSGQSASDSVTVQLTFANATALPLQGTLYGYAFTNAYSSIALAVPETHPLALWAAGLGALGLVTRRRLPQR
jgi:hypothetical protein